MVPKTKKKPERRAPRREPESATGKYVFDAVQGKVVKVSDRTPKVASRSSSDGLGPCGRPREGCGGGSCPS